MREDTMNRSEKTRRALARLSRDLGLVEARLRQVAGGQAPPPVTELRAVRMSLADPTQRGLRVTDR
jgi:hypothetical protein